MNSLSPPFYVKAKFSYKGTYPEDLVFTKGAILLVTEIVAAGEWWKARRLAEDGTEMEGEEGNVPQGYFTVLKDYNPTPAPAPAPTPATSGPPPVPLSSRPKTSTLPSSTEPSKLNSLPSASPPPSSDPSPPAHHSLKPTPSNSSFRTFPPQPSNSSPEPPVTRNWTPPSRANPSSSNSASAAPPPSKPSRDSSPAVAPTETAEDEPVFTSLKDRMAALNGRGLSVSGAPPPPPSSSSRPALVARSSSVAHPSPTPATATAPPPPSRRPTSSSSNSDASSLVPPPLKPRPKLPSSMSSSSSSTRSETVPPPPKAHDSPPPTHSLNTSTAPPRLPPRLPPRRPSSNVETSGGEDSTPAPPIARRLPPSVPRSNSTTNLSTPSLPARLPSPAAQPPTLSSSSSSNPPPPPRRQPNLPPPSALPKPPPRPETPPPLTSTSLYPHPNAQPLSASDLSIHTGWFARQPLTLPPSILSIRNGRPAASAQFSRSGGPSFLNLGIMYGDRSRTFITISWGDGVPASNPTVEQVHTGPPRRRTLEELDEAAVCYGERIARWCEEREGTQVGRGECWDLADLAIKEVGRELREETGGEHEGLAEAIEHEFGEVVYVNLEGRMGWGEERKIRRGDVVQFVYATFKTMFSDGSSTTSTAGTPQTGHTAVVIEDWAGVGGAPIKVLQSNVGGSPLTRRGEFRLRDLVSGEVRAFRVMDEEWGGGPARASL